MNYSEIVNSSTQISSYLELGNTSSAGDACGWLVTPAEEQKSQDLSYLHLRYLDLCSYPILLLLATVGNAVNLNILFGERSSGSRNNCLIAIALVDVLFMWCGIFAYIDSYDAELYGRTRPSIHAVYETVAGVTIFLQEACFFASAWLTLAFTVERYLAIKYPLKYIGKRNPTIVITISFLALLTSFIRIIDYYWVYDNYLRLVPKPAIKPSRPAGLMTWYKTYVWAQAIIPAVTFPFIFTLNILLLFTISRQQYLRRTSLELYQARKKVTKSDWCALPMLGCCVLLYLVTQIPGFVGNILYLLDKSCLSKKNEKVDLFLIPVQNFLGSVYFSSNFLLYCGVNSRFREKSNALIIKFLRKVLPVFRQKELNESIKSLGIIAK